MRKGLRAALSWVTAGGNTLIDRDMNGLRSYLMHNRAVAALVLAATLLLRAVVPTGYMVAPAQEARQAFVTVCTGLEGKAVRIALPTSAKHGSDTKSHDGKDSPCAFTALAGLADVPTVPAIAPLDAIARLPAADRFAVGIGRGLAAPPPPQTGPPAIV